MPNEPYSLAKLSLTVRKVAPENKETPISFIDSEFIDKKLFYRRNHFPYPDLPLSNYWLPVNGFVETQRLFSLQEITRMPSKTIKLVLECSGNKRGYFKPKVFGEQWEKGAINQGYWKGVPLKNLIEAAGVKQGAKEVVVEGYDFGNRPDLEHPVSFARSLPLDKAFNPDTIIAYEYNGEPLSFKHGFPLRLIVPQWYAMASVKWVKQISVIDSKFAGVFQSIDYVYYPNKKNDEGAFPVTVMNVNSTIQTPLEQEILDTGRHLIKGIAWTGKGFITKVEISTNNGFTWHNATLLNPQNQGYGWSFWTYEWSVLEKGEYTIMSKAVDSYNRVQPAAPFWNRKGYGYHAIDKVKVKIQ